MTTEVNAVGVWFYAHDTNRYLYLMRNDERNPYTWGLPGGRVEDGETLLDALVRECHEELGYMPQYGQIVPIEKFTSSDSMFSYHTFFCDVGGEFTPRLNEEHLGWAWIDRGVTPRPLHPGLRNTVNFDAVQEKMKSLEAKHRSKK